MRAALGFSASAFAAAELMTDGRLSPRVLADVALMRGLPLYAAPGGDTTLDAATLAAQAVREAEALMKLEARAYAGACRDLGEANRRFDRPIYKGLQPRPRTAERMRRDRSMAMRRINVTRARLRAAEKALEAARATLAAAAS